MTTTERLTGVFDLAYNPLWSFSAGTNLVLPYDRPSGTFAVPGADRGIDPRGTLPNLLARQEITWTFKHVYDSAYPSWTALHDGMIRAFGYRGTIILQKLTGAQPISAANPTGAPLTLVCTAKLVKLDRHQDTDNSPFSATPTVTFEQYEDWRPLRPAGAVVYDGGAKYDSTGVKYDKQGFSASLTGTAMSFTLTNNGTVPEVAAVVAFYGVIGGPFALYNLSADLAGMPVTPPPAAPVTGQTMFFAVNDSLAANNLYAINNGTGQVYSSNTGVVPYTKIARPAGQQHMMVFVPGDNTLAFVAASVGSNAFLSIYALDRYG